MITVGVDLASQAQKTAVARLRWANGGATVEELVMPADDDDIIEAVRDSAKAGIDCPFGWPDEFVTFVSAHRAGHLDVPPSDPDWWRPHALRVTDRAVYELTRSTTQPPTTTPRRRRGRWLATRARDGPAPSPSRRSCGEAIQRRRGASTG